MTDDDMDGVRLAYHPDTGSVAVSLVEDVWWVVRRDGPPFDLDSYGVDVDGPDSHWVEAGLVVPVTGDRR